MREYLQTHIDMRRKHMTPPKGFTYVCFEDYVLTNGTLQVLSEALTEEEEQVLKDSMQSQHFRAKECFYNAQVLVLFDSSDLLKYQEGYASGSVGLPMHHAWVTINGKVIDMTWRQNKDRSLPIETLLANKTGEAVLGIIPEHWQYLGVEFDKETIRARMINTKSGASLIDNWEDDYPLLREPRKEK